MDNIYLSWTLPWQGAESLLGIMVAENIAVVKNGEHSTASLISLGLIFVRLDILYNFQEIEKEN